MNIRYLILGGSAVLSMAVPALSSFSTASRNSDEAMVAQSPNKSDHFSSRQHAHAVRLANLFGSGRQDDRVPKFEVLGEPDAEEFMLFDEQGSGWLGVETHEVTAEKAKELKLPAERGVVLGKIIPDSPAAKAGLKENDVVTSINGQPIEGAFQFRRVIHEIPAGRTVQLTVWRDGRTQNITTTLGKAEERRRSWTKAAVPGTFAFRIPEIPDLPDVPEMDFGNEMFLLTPHPRLGIDAEDLNGQLGSFFGAPEGEGILVRDVNSGSPAEKAGLKAGDVITSLDGDRIRSVGDLREKLAAKHDGNPGTVKLGVLRNKSELAVIVEIPAPPKKTKHALRPPTSI